MDSRNGEPENGSHLWESSRPEEFSHMYLLHYLKSIFFTENLQPFQPHMSLPCCMHHSHNSLTLSCFFTAFPPTHTVVSDILQDLLFLMAKLSHHMLCEVSHAYLQFLNFRHLFGLNLHFSLYTSKWHRVNVTVNACPCLGLGGMSQKQAGCGASEMDYLSWESERHIVFADFWDATHVVQKAVTIFYDVTVLLLIQPHLSSHFLLLVSFHFSICHLLLVSQTCHAVLFL